VNHREHGGLGEREEPQRRGTRALGALASRRHSGEVGLNRGGAMASRRGDFSPPSERGACGMPKRPNVGASGLKPTLLGGGRSGPQRARSTRRAGLGEEPAEARRPERDAEAGDVAKKIRGERRTSNDEIPKYPNTQIPKYPNTQIPKGNPGQTLLDI
jgi:hypothetical protein